MNILFITADQWRAECLSCLEHPLVQTPTLDALAADAVLFERHYAQAAPCSPSRTSMHTGLYMQNHRCVSNGTPVDARLTNWALEARKAGYDPSLFGYTDTAKDPRGLSANDPRLQHYSEPLPGIGHFTPMKMDASLAWVESLAAKGYELPEFWGDIYGRKESGRDYADGGAQPLPLAIKTEDHETHFMVDKCGDWIRAQTKPWITHLSLLRPHPPFVAPSPYHKMFNPDDMPPPIQTPTRDAARAQHPFLAGALELLRHPALGDSPQHLRELRQQQAAYYGLMREVDDNLARLFEQLQKHQQWDDTLIIFTTDHGEQMGDHHLMGKLGFYEQSYHIPLIIRDPRAEANLRGRRVDAFTENIDLMPTMLDWLGLPTPAQCDGQSLLPFLRGQTPKVWRDAAHWEFDFRNETPDAVKKQYRLTAHQCTLNVIRDAAFKYVHFTALPPLLFDMQNDARETVNLAADPAYAATTMHYAQKMLSWRMNHDERALTDYFLSGDGVRYREDSLYFQA